MGSSRANPSVSEDDTQALSHLDTSGVVQLPEATPGHIVGLPNMIWSDLTPFTQGYVEALFDSATAYLRNFKGFSDLAPETLARIMEDCERWQRLYPKTTSGANFWRCRTEQLVERPDFPALTPYLGDDGLIYLRDAAVQS